MHRAAEFSPAPSRVPVLVLCAAACVGAGVRAEAVGPPRVSLTQAPLVMRLSKDEFRIAFGVDGERCFPNGCHGLIRYRVQWTAEDGTARSEIKRVNYAVWPRARRSVAVDRQYFDTAEGEHTTEIVTVRVDLITCDGGADSHGL
jgi:hypothetical protein